jgi:hypothetical protein
MMDSGIRMLLEEVLTGIREIRLDISHIKESDIEQNAQLAEHIRRTEIAERRLEKLEDEVVPELLLVLEALKEEMRPKPVNWKAVLGYVSTITLIIGGLVTTAVKLGWV